MVILLQLLLDFGSSLSLFTQANASFLTAAVGVWFPKVSSSRSFIQTFGIPPQQSQSLRAGRDGETCVLTAGSCQAPTARFCGPQNLPSDLNTEQCSHKERKTPFRSLRRYCSVLVVVVLWRVSGG